MATERRSQLILAVALVALAGVGYWSWMQTSTVPAPSSNATGSSTAVAGGKRTSGSTVEAPDVHIDELEAERPKPGGPERNLFRFRPKAPQAPTPVAARPGPPTPPVAVAPPTPTGPPPPIALKFVGVVKREGQPTIAILTDGNGEIHGVEGGTIAGKYRILRIGAESIEMAYLDGRGRQTIRLSGS